MGNRVLVMVPKLVLGTVKMRIGCPRLAVLNRLKISIRNWTRRVPPIGVFFVIDKSTFRNPGPYTALRGRLPKWNVPSAETGIANTDEAVHDPAMRGSHALLSNH